MNKSVKFVQAPISKRLIAMTLDILCVVITTIALYFMSYFAIIKTCTPYSSNKTYIQERMVDEGLTLKSGLVYEEYDTQIKSFYLRHESEIVELYSARYDKRLTIQHIYNINILELPVEPTLDTLKTEYFTYIQKESTGEIDVNTFGIVIPGEHNKKFYSDVAAIFEMQYDHLNNLLVSIDKTYNAAVMENLRLESYTRLAVFSISILIFYLIIPLCNKFKCTIFERRYGFAHINNGNGYRVSLFKVLLRPLIFWGLTLFFIASSVNLKMIIVGIIPIFLDYLLMMFTKSNRTIDQFILSTAIVDEGQSLIFNNEVEEKDYENSDEFKQIEDEDYLSRLESVSSFNISESRSDELNNNKK